MTMTEKIDSIIQSKKMSRRQLAIKAGIPPSSLQSAMERGKNLSLEMLEKIASALNVDMIELLPFSEEEKQEVKSTAEALEYAGQESKKANLSAAKMFQADAFLKKMRENAENVFLESSCDDEFLENMLLEAFSELPRWDKIYTAVQLYGRAFPYIEAYKQSAEEKMKGMPSRRKASYSVKNPNESKQ